jgi:uncharacterized protein with FMN-binding domain
MPGGFVRKAVLTLGGTAAGLAALLSFKTHSPASAAAAVSTPDAQATTAPATTAPATTAPVTSAPATKTTASKAPATASAGTATASTSTASQTRSITGAVETTPYGPMQVKITLTGQQITAVTVLQETNDGAESQQIDSFSIPKLTSETLTAQSTRIDTVSGATATSTGYIGSLQSALDQA